VCTVRISRVAGFFPEKRGESPRTKGGWINDSRRRGKEKKKNPFNVRPGRKKKKEGILPQLMGRRGERGFF